MTAIETSPPPSVPDTPGSDPKRTRRIPLGILVWALVALGILSLADSWTFRAVIAAVFVVGIAFYRSPLRPLFPILIAVSGVLGLLYGVGSYSWLLDVAALAVAALVVALVSIMWRRVRRPAAAQSPEPTAQSRSSRRRTSTAIAIGFVLAWWLAVTAADTIVMRQAARREWGTGTSACPQGLAKPDWAGLRQPRVAMAISGGGYRAALYHAGVLAGLECIDIPVTALSTVSGGSIIGAYYAVGGEPHAFRSMVVAGLFNVKRELLHVDNALRFVGSMLSDLIGRDHPDTRFTQTDVQASLIDRLLYRGLRMSDLDSIGAPRLMVNVTDLVSSERIAITPRGVLQPISYDPINRQDYANPTGLVGWYGEFAAFREAVPDRWPASEPLARIVAASGAFPGAMRPVAVYAPKEVFFDTTRAGWYVMADGGIADNTGLATVRDAISLARDYSAYQKCVAAYAADAARSIEATCGEKPWGVSNALEPWLVDIVVMSDGSAMPKASIPTTTLAELATTADVMYRMSGPQRPPADDTTVAKTPVLLVSPKAFQRDAEDSVYWASPLENAPREAHRAYRSLQLWSFDLDVGTIRFMIDHMREADRARATEVLKAIEADRRIRDGVWRGAGEAAEPPSDAERTLHDLVKAELRRRIAVFATTSTLKDQLDAETAESLFLLGQYLVMINRHSLHEQIARAVYPRGWQTPQQPAAPEPVAPPTPQPAPPASDSTTPPDTTARP